MLTNNNLILATDSYKTTQWSMLKPGTTHLANYFECRGSDHYKKIKWFGLDYYIKVLYDLQEQFDQSKIDYADKFLAHHFSNKHVFNKKGWTDFLNKKKGKLPLLIKAAPENILIEPGNVLFTTESTDPEFVWMVQIVESLLMKCWYSTSVCTYSYHCLKIVEEALSESGENIDEAPFKLVDFGFRGTSTDQSSEIGGLAHLMNFKVSDNLPAIKLGMDLYNLPMSKMLGFSVPATEHSIAQLFEDDDKAYILHCLEMYPTGILSLVIDKKDTLAMTDLICKDKDIREKILNRDGTFVLRPDSGDPVQITQQVFERLWNSYGGNFTMTGHKLLDSHVRIIQGDGINIDSIYEIYHNFLTKGYAAGNLIFGSGGKLLQDHRRDDLRCAIKASYAIVDGKEVNLFKQPKTDSGKGSKPGKLKLLRGADDQYNTINSTQMNRILFDGYKDELRVVFNNGEIVRTPRLK